MITGYLEPFSLVLFGVFSAENSFSLASAVLVHPDAVCARLNLRPSLPFHQPRAVDDDNDDDSCNDDDVSSSWHEPVWFLAFGKIFQAALGSSPRMTVRQVATLFGGTFRAVCLLHGARTSCQQKHQQQWVKGVRVPSQSESMFAVWNDL